MADGTTFVKVTTTQATPEDYLLSGAASIDLLAVRADFDGSGAAGDYVPVVQIVNEANEVMLTVRGDTETAGDSASYTFAPFLRGVTAGATPTPVTAHEEFQGNAVSINDGSTGNLTWDTSFGPDTLLDISIPDLPRFITAGVYAVTVAYAVNTLTDQGGYAADLEVDTSGPTFQTVVATVNITNPSAAITVVYYADAGSLVRARVNNRDSVSARFFTLANATVQKIT